jgi:hypothetical protein
MTYNLNFNTPIKRNYITLNFWITFSYISCTVKCFQIHAFFCRVIPALLSVLVPSSFEVFHKTQLS